MNNEKEHISNLLERFMNGESTLAEEELLSRYFATHEVDAEWEPYKQMFAYFDSGMADAAKPAPAPDAEQAPQRKVVRFRWLRVAAAAAVALLFATGLWQLFDGSDELPQVDLQTSPGYAQQSHPEEEPDTARSRKVMATDVAPKSVEQRATVAATARPSRHFVEPKNDKIVAEDLQRMAEAHYWAENTADASCALAMEEMIEARRAVEREAAMFADTVDVQLTQVITVP
ncbi:MAG: hypothetical protein ACI30V_03815 [Muribaculaceae bacterium]